MNYIPKHVLKNTLNINTAKRASTILYRFLLNSKIDVWILPANICYIVPLVFLKAEKKIQFVDVYIDSYLTDECELSKILKNDIPMGILLNHSYGIEHDFSTLANFIKEKFPESSIIEDKCLCIPEILERLNPHIDLVIFSTGYSKYCDF